MCYWPLAEHIRPAQSRSLCANLYERWRFGFISNTASTRRSVSRRRAAHCSLSDSRGTPADDDDEDDGFECLGSMTAEERAAESRRAAEAAGNVLEIPESPVRPKIPQSPPPRPFPEQTS